MTADITPAVRYRMPAVFGPAPGPRQKADGSRWAVEETGTMRQSFLTLDFLGVAEQLERLLPPGFRLRGEPVVSLRLGFFRDLYWLAGRSYGVLYPLLPVTYTGRDETVDGDFMPVIWEGLADAIITGRDELGFPKLVADFAELDVDLAAGRAAGAVSWLGHTFFDLSLRELTEIPDAVAPSPSPNLTFKYVPRTSVNGSGGADIASVTVMGADKSSAGAGLAPTSYRRWTAEGDFTWHRATFEQQPTTFHIIGGLADLDVVELRGGSMYELAGPGLLIAGNDQRTIEPAKDGRYAQPSRLAGLVGAR